MGNNYPAFVNLNSLIAGIKLAFSWLELLSLINAKRWIGVSFSHCCTEIYKWVSAALFWTASGILLASNQEGRDKIFLKFKQVTHY